MRSRGSRSLRVRLALWHAGLLGVTLVVLSLLTLVLLRSALSSRLDATLEDYADKTARSVADQLYEAAMPGRSEPASFLATNVEKPWGVQAQLVDARTGSVREKTSGLDYRLMTTLDERVNGLKGEPTFDTRHEPGQYPLRVVTMPVQMGRHVPYLVQAVEQLGGIEDALQRTAGILLVLAPSMFVLSLFGGWLLVGRSLRPVDQMTRTALAMEPGRLDHRIEPGGSDDEVSRLASAFNQMMTRLDRSFRQVQQFSADASHELKTPLTSIRGQAEVALMGELQPEEYRAVLRSIVDDTGRMSSIVEDLLLLARADAEQIAMRCQRVAAHEIALEVYEQLAPAAARKGLQLDIGEMADGDVLADSFWAGQIVTNLLSNAIKYTPMGGRVTLSVDRLEAVATPQEAVGDPQEAVGSREQAPEGRSSTARAERPSSAGPLPQEPETARRTGGSALPGTRHGAENTQYAIRSQLDASPITPRTSGNLHPSALNPRPSIAIRVSDTGPGIAPEHLPRIFDRFYRVDSGRSRDAGGVGLGLNIAQWAAQAQGGRIEVESEVGAGSTFTLYLPLAPPASR